MVLGKEALVFRGSPMCKSLSKLMNWNWKRMDPDKKEKMTRERKTHLQFCMTLYKIRVETGMYPLHQDQNYDERYPPLPGKVCPALN